MKKSVLIMCLLLGGCSLMHFSDDEKAKNPQCASFEKDINVFAVYDQFLLGTICSNRYNNVCLDQQVIYLSREKGVLYYDGLTLPVPEGKCITYVDSYSLNKDLSVPLTIPVVKFVDKK